MITALHGRPMMASTPRFAVTEHTVPRAAGTYLDRGILFASRGDFEMAIHDFTEALRLRPNWEAAYMLRGRALQASVLHTTDIQASFEQFTSRHVSGRVTTEQARVLNLAIEDFSRAIRLDPNNARFYRERGWVHSNLWDFDRAIADLSQAIRLTPNSAGAYATRGAIHLNRGNFDLAIADFNQAIRLDPNNANAFASRGIVHFNRGNINQSVADLEAALRIEPNHPSARGNLDIVRRYRGW